MAIQGTWLLGLGWDDELPIKLKKRCQQWLQGLPELAVVQVPRCYRTAGKRIADTSIRMYEVVRVSSISRTRLVYFPERILCHEPEK